jgi:hypothetical protein
MLSESPRFFFLCLLPSCSNDIFEISKIYNCQ